MFVDRYPIDALITHNIDKISLDAEARLYHAMSAMNTAPHHGLPAGIALMVDEEMHLLGVLTDGDIRKALLAGKEIQTPVSEVMTRNPVAIPDTIPPDEVLDEVRRQIRESGRMRTIRHAILVDEDRRVVGLIDVSRLAQSQSWYWDTIGVIGLGYVGLTLAVSLAEVGFEVIGWDSNPEIREKLARGEPHVHETGLESLLHAQLEKGRFIVAQSYEEIKRCAVFMVAVNTPVERMTPDLSYVRQAITELTTILKPGDLVVLRSTVPIGTCRSEVVSIIEANTDFVVGRDIGLAFAPERTIQGKALEELRSLPQVIGGFNGWSTEGAARIFARLAPTIVRVGSLEEAEFVKLINNTFRDISFAFANEVAMMCEAYNLDAARVIKAANSGYPRNPVALPSPGVGGACLVKDPYMFANLSRAVGTPSLAETSRAINEYMPQRIAQRLLAALAESGKIASEANIFVVGFAFKGEPETNDLRGSPALDFVHAIQDSVRQVWGFDHVIPRADIEAQGIVWKELEEGFSSADAVLFMNNHRDLAKVNIYKLVKQMNLPGIFFDGWSFFDPEALERTPGVRYMSLGYLTPIAIKQAAHLP